MVYYIPSPLLYAQAHAGYHPGFAGHGPRGEQDSIVL